MDREFDVQQLRALQRIKGAGGQPMKALRHVIAILTPGMNSTPVVSMMMLGFVALTDEQALRVQRQHSWRAGL